VAGSWEAPPRKLLTVAEVARLLAVDRDFFYAHQAELGFVRAARYSAAARRVLRHRGTPLPLLLPAQQSLGVLDVT
jgi:hypothetical protein